MKNMIKVEREKKNMSQRELATALGITEGTLRSMELDRYMPSVILATKMARYFGVSTDYLYYVAEGMEEREV